MTTSRRLPQWLKAKMPGSKNYIEVKNLINKNIISSINLMTISLHFRSILSIILI